MTNERSELKAKIEELGMQWVDRMPWMLADEPLANMSFKAGAAAAISLILQEAERLAFEMLIGYPNFNQFEQVVKLSDLQSYASDSQEREGESCKAKCEDCGVEIINDCQFCGAPQCCPRCCDSTRATPEADPK